MGAKEQAERLEIIVTDKDRQISTLTKENADLREMLKKVEKLEREIEDADPLYVKGYTRADGTYVKPYRKKQ